MSTNSDPGILPEWFETAERIAKGIKAKTQGSERARYSVYVVLLRNEEKAEWGLYVGTTGLRPEERFLNHKAGRKSGKGWVERFGVTLAPSLFAHFNPCEYEEALEIERQLLILFPVFGVPWVHGS